MKIRGLLVVIAAATVLLPVLVRADLTVKEQTQMNGMMGMLSSKGTETTYIKNDKMRTEGQMEMSGMVKSAGKTTETLTITRLDKGVMWIVNNQESTYTEIPLTAAVDSVSQSFKLKDISVKKTGQTKDIIGYKCDGVDVAMTFEAVAREGKGAAPQTYSMDFLFWMRPEVKDLEELRHFWDQMVEVAKVSQKGSPMGDAMITAFGKLKELQGVPLGAEVTMENPAGTGGQDAQQQAKMQEAMKMLGRLKQGQGKAQGNEQAASGPSGMKFTYEVTGISKDAVADGVFEVPKGYKKTAQAAAVKH
ncbi:MAG TPA: DUF4412 domain-containing protein [bacterium]|nr:DUF4412 domain-containing protein [bacterium]